MPKPQDPQPTPHILLVGNYKPDGQYSMQGYTRLLEELFDAHQIAYTSISPSVIVNRLKTPNKLLGYIDKYIFFPGILRRTLHRLRKQCTQPIVAHIGDHSNAPYLRPLKTVPRLITCHDLIAVRSALNEFSTQKTRFTGKILQAWIRNSLKQATHIACVSWQTQKDLLRLTPITPKHSTVVYSALTYPFQRQSKQQALKRLAPFNLAKPLQPFLLHVGSNVWYKNRIGLLHIYHALRNLWPECPNLIIAGEPPNDAQQAFIQTKNLEQQIYFFPNCSTQQLEALYSLAELFLFPSLLEGLGWPPLEAQACGCPVAISKRAPMTETCAQTAIYINPEDYSQAAHTIYDFLQSPKEHKQKIRQAGLNNLKRFTPEQMFEQYMQCYQKCLAKKNNA